MWTIANALSLVRILLIPVFLVLLIRQKGTAAFVVFLFAASTDLLDGFAARFWNQKSKLGAVLDPAADKLLMTASFIILTIPSLNAPNRIPIWLTSSVIGRDLLIVSAAFFLYKRYGQTEFPPTFTGKLSTALQMGVLLLVLLFNLIGTSPPSLKLFYILTLFLTVLSFIHYAIIGLRMTRLNDS